MKKLYIIGLLALLLLPAAACSTDGDDPEGLTSNADSESAVSSERYLAIQILAPNDDEPASTADGEASRSGDFTLGKTYANGDDAESTIDISKLVFYFFDDNGNAVCVTSAGKNFTTALSSTNADNIGSTEQTNGSSVSHIVDAVVMLRNVSTVPTQVVAVANTDTVPSTECATLDGLSKHTISSGFTADWSGITGFGNFVMSSATYVDLDASGNPALMRTTAISAANLCRTTADALANPVQIYVERAVSKVEVVAAGKNLFDVKTSVTDADAGTTTPLYVKLLSWTTFDQLGGTSLMKQLTVDSYGDAVNKIADHRSFWMDYSDYTKYSFTKQTVGYYSMSQSIGTGYYLYPFENRPSANSGYATKVIMAAQVVDADGNPVAVGKYRGQLYTLADLRQVIYNLLKDNKVITNLTLDDVSFAQVPGKYYAQLARLPRYSSSYKYYCGDGKTRTYIAATTYVNEWLAANAPKILVWTDGKCYYYDYIRHQVTGSALSKANDTKMNVRNNWYRLTVLAIEGLGTPVTSDDDTFNPTRPDDEDWTLKSQIDIQAWRIVPTQLNFESTKTDQDYEEELASGD
jgi:hypothetical protein